MIEAPPPIRELPKHLHREQWDDVPAKIGQAMGGRDFFADEDLRYVHRIGLGHGLGWRIAGVRSDGIDYIKVMKNAGGSLDMIFLHAGDRPPFEADEIRCIGCLSYGELGATYEKELNQ